MSAVAFISGIGRTIVLYLDVPSFTSSGRLFGLTICQDSAGAKIDYGVALQEEIGE
jgi:hypothetical protein